MTVHLFGIRHHGPGSARSVVASLTAVDPTVVLVEAPAEATGVLDWIGGRTDAAGDRLEPPVALLGHVVADPHRAVFAPFAEFSPEWQAVRWAAASGVPVEAIDLPLAVTLAGAAGPSSLADPVPVDPLAALAAAAGEPDPERWWEDVVEHRGDGPPAFAAVAEAMTAVRAGVLVGVDEQRREAHMRQRIRAALAAGHERVAVVCGAWHVPALDLATAPTAAADRALLRGLPKVKVALSWVPWTHERLASATGYGAGVESPGWYDHVFRHPGRDGVGRFVVAAARVLRDAGLPASPDHLVGATRLADALAAIRERPRAGLAEVLDAADAVMGGLPLVRRRLVVGEAIGQVPGGAPQVPLARDLARRQQAARLRPVPGAQVLELDLRTTGGLRRSRLLRQVAALGIPWGTVTEGRSSTGTFRETWRVEWRPEWSLRVVERAADGTTLEQAATTRLVDRAAATTRTAELAAVLDDALLADLPGAVDPVLRRLARRAADDPDLFDLMASLEPLARVRRYGDVRATDTAALAEVFDGLVVRVVAGAVAACTSLDDAAADLAAQRIGEVQRALALVDHPARHDAFPAVLDRLAAPDGSHGRLQGRATRLLHDGGHWPAPAVERRLGRALSPGTPPAVGAAFVEGFLAGSGTLLVHDAPLRDIVDRWLASLRPEAFVETVPLLRRTFASFDAAERRQIGRLVAGSALPGDDLPAGSFDTGRAAEALTTVRRLLGLPAHERPVEVLR